MWSLLIGGLLVNAASFIGQPRESTTTEAAVYAAVLADHRCSGRSTAGARGENLVLKREAVLPVREWWWNAFPHEDFPAAIPKWLTGIEPQTVRRFLNVAATPSVLDVMAQQPPKVLWIPREEVQALGKGGAFWDRFYKRYPSATGLIELSGIGFSADRREALVYCGLTSGSLSGKGHLVLLRHDGQRWKATAWRQVWQS